jgi:CheY-like chemotaxis protein
LPACEWKAAEFPAATSGGLLSVLIVDDDELVQVSTRKLVELLGHAPVSVGSGEEALATLEHGLQAQVVILDMNMPGLGGAGTLPRLRARWPDLPVLVATGRVDQDALELADHHSHTVLMPKPYSIDELRQQLGALVARRGTALAPAVASQSGMGPAQ